MNLSQKALQVCNFLDSTGIKYEAVTHSPAYTLEECRKINEIINGTICKNLLLKTDSGKVIYLLLIKDGKRFVTKDVSKKLGCSRLSFAPDEYMENLLNTTAGSLSITSLIFDKEKKVRLAIDKDVADDDYICCHPSDNTATLKIKTEDIMKTFLPALEIKAEIIEI